MRKIIKGKIFSNFYQIIKFVDLMRAIGFVSVDDVLMNEVWHMTSKLRVILEKIFTN